MDVSEKAVLISLSVSFFRASVTDKTVNGTIAETYETHGDAGRFTKQTMAKTAIADYKRRAYDLVSYYKSVTLPWDEKYRILPSEIFEKTMIRIRALISNLDESIDTFCAAYPTLVAQEQERLGKLWKRDDYPPASEIRDKFGVDMDITPVPKVGDFRIHISQDEMDTINRRLEKKITAKLGRSISDAWKRLYKVVEDMSDRIEKGQPRNTVVTNITDLTSILGALNIVDDPNLEQMRREVENRLCQHTGKEIRENEDIKKNLKAATADILGKMAPFVAGGDNGHDSSSKESDRSAA